MATRSRLLVLLAVFALLVASCAGDDTSDDAGTEATEEETGSDTDSAGDSSADDDPADDDPAEDTDGSEELSGEPVKIGALTSLTGPFTSWGLHVEAGMQLAVDELNAAGGIDGRPVELLVADDQSDPEEGVVQFERLVEEGVIAIYGTISSGVGGATAPLAEERQVPLFLSKAGSDALLTTDSRYTFRACLPSGPMMAGPWFEYAESEGFTKVGSMIADYAWGQSFLTASEAVVADFPSLELKSEVAPVQEQDFTTYLRSLDEFEPDLILATGHPPGSGPILAQVADLGLDARVSGPGSSLTAVLEAAGDTAIDRYADHSCADYFSPEYGFLAARYVVETDLEFMEDDAVAAYGIVNVLAEAVEAVGDDPQAIADYVRTGTFETPGMAFPFAWTEWGELAEAEMILVTVGAGPAPGGLNLAGDWWPELLSQSSPLEPYVPGS